MIRDKLVFGHRDDRVKERMLREPDLTLTKALDICHAAESTHAQLREMSGGANNVAVHAVRGQATGKVRSRSNYHPFPNKTNQNVREYQGRSCNSTHKFGNCLAYGKTCRKCGGKNHFASFHKSQPNSVQTPHKRVQTVSENVQGAEFHRQQHMLQIKTERTLYFSELFMCSICQSRV